MLHTDHPEYTRSETNGSVASAWGTSVTSGAANTYGTWTQIHAGFTFPASQVFVSLGGMFKAATTRNAYIDIGIGPDSANVTNLVPYLCASHSGGVAGGGTRDYFFPLYIPSGTPIWARHQNTGASVACPVHITGYTGQIHPGGIGRVSRYQVIGTPTTASTQGIAITPGEGAEGAWTQMVASTTNDYVGILCSGVFAVDTTMSATTYVADIGIGTAGAETTLTENAMNCTHTTLEQATSFAVGLFTNIPAGTRVAARLSCSTTPDSSISMLVLGMIGG